MPEPVTFRTVEMDSAEYRAAICLREAVLRAPLGLTLSAEELAVEPQCQHFGAFDGEALVATLLLITLDAETVKMRQVAVDPSRQGNGIGAGLVRFAEAAARALGFRQLVANARGTAVPFYQRLGYTVEGDPFLEQTIPHQRVSKALG